MVITSVVGMATKLVESMLAVKYRGMNDRGEIAGGPMYTCLHAFPHTPASPPLPPFRRVPAAPFSVGILVHRMLEGTVLAGTVIEQFIAYLDNLVWGPWMLGQLTINGRYLHYSGIVFRTCNFDINPHFLCQRAEGLAENEKYYVTSQELTVDDTLTEYLYSEKGLYWNVIIALPLSKCSAAT